MLQSGVYLATGYNGSSDGLSIADMAESRHIVSSGKFHTRSSDLTAHNNDYFVNSDLESVEINGTTRLNKNRAYKYSSSAFNVQDPSLSTSDILYYPKNEIHIPNRKSLTKNQDSRKFDYNFVFVNSQVYNEDLLVVLPSDSWSASNKLEKVAVVNMGKMPVTVVDFNRDETQVVNANSVVFISNEIFDSVSQYAIVKNTANGYTFSSEDGFTDDASVSIGGITRAAFSGRKEKYYVSHAGDIILDYSVQNDKTIFIEDNVRFRAPYQYS